MCKAYATPTELSIFVIFMVTYICCEIYNQMNKKSLV